MIINDCRFIASVSIPPLDLLVHRYRQHAKSGEPGNDECPHYANPNCCEPFEQDGRLHDPQGMEDKADLMFEVVLPRSLVSLDNENWAFRFVVAHRNCRFPAVRVAGFPQQPLPDLAQIKRLLKMEMLRHKTSWATATKGILVFPLLPDVSQGRREGVCPMRNGGLTMLWMDARRWREQCPLVPKGTDEALKGFFSQQIRVWGCSFDLGTVTKRATG